MTKSILFASILGALALGGDPFLCSADGDDAGGGAASSGGGTALTSDTPPADPGAGGIEHGLYGDGKEGDKQSDTGAADDKQSGDDDGDKKEGEGEAWKEYVPDETKTDEENAALKAEHDKTKPAEEDKGKKPGDTSEIKPEDYEFVEIPEGFELDPAIETEFREYAAKNNLPKEVVKDLTGMQIKLYAKQSEAHADKVAQWAEDLKADKEVGGPKYDENMAKAREARQAFWPPEVNVLIDKTGLGNHPAFVKGFVRVGKAMGEGTTLPGKPGAANTTILENLYGSE